MSANWEKGESVRDIAQSLYMSRRTLSRVLSTW
jgi:transcriptional regulator GlxA family with amidase domain